MRGPAAGSDVDFERANVRVATFVWMTIIGTYLSALLGNSADQLS